GPSEKEGEMALRTGLPCGDISEKVSTSGRKKLITGFPDDQCFLDLQAAKAKLIVGKLDIDYHARFEHCRGGAETVCPVASDFCENGRFIHLQADSVTNMVTLIVRNTGLTDRSDPCREERADRHSRTDHSENRINA